MHIDPKVRRQQLKAQPRRMKVAKAISVATIFAIIGWLTWTIDALMGYGVTLTIASCLVVFAFIRPPIWPFQRKLYSGIGELVGDCVRLIGALLTGSMLFVGVCAAFGAGILGRPLGIALIILSLATTVCAGLLRRR